MALPLPRIIADVEAGGPIVTAMRGMNALTQSNLENQIKRIQAQYAPLTTQADAASKLAYANLMGPQFLAKLLGNPDILANLGDDKVKNALDITYKAGSGNGTGASILSNLPIPSSSPNSLLGFVWDKFKNLFDNQSSSPAKAATSTSNAILHPPSVVQPSTQVGAPSRVSQEKPIPEQNEDSSPYLNTPAGRKLKNSSNAGIGEFQPLATETKPSFAENTATYEGIKEEGRESGKIRAKHIGELDDEYQHAIEASEPINHMIEIVKNPKFQNLRKYPGFQNLQMNVKANFGTPEEQKLIGDFQVTATKALAEAVNGFRGRILDKEVTMANKMKISPNDTFNVMIGKLPSIATFNDMVLQRASLASRMMQQEHINKGEALRKADKLVNGKEIRERVENELENSQMVTIKNPMTGEIITIPLKEARAGGFKGG